MQNFVHTCEAFKKLMPCVPLIDYVASLWKKENSMKQSWSKYFHGSLSVFVATSRRAQARASIPSSSIQATT